MKLIDPTRSLKMESRFQFHDFQISAFRHERSFRSGGRRWRRRRRCSTRRPRRWIRTRRLLRTRSGAAAAAAAAAAGKTQIVT